MRKRTGNDPTRRIIEAGALTSKQLGALEARALYVGSGHHKRNPSDYGLDRTSPRPTKSLCDSRRTIKLSEAQTLLATGIKKGLISRPLDSGLPKYVWSVSEAGEVFEAKTDASTPGQYHGYPLDDDMLEVVLDAWKRR